MSAMSPLCLDYQRPLPRHDWPGFLLLAAGALFCSGLLIQSFLLSDDVAATGKQVLKLKREVERQRLFASSGAPVASVADKAKRSISPSAARWELLLVALENAGNDSVTLLVLEPSVREISISGEAKNFDAVLDYVKRLQIATIFADVYLLKHELITESPYRPVRFALLAKWREGMQ
jgi:hypothetical protein